MDLKMVYISDLSSRHCLGPDLLSFGMVAASWAVRPCKHKHLVHDLEPLQMHLSPVFASHLEWKADDDLFIPGNV